ncbi:MAG TPA: hypothetical protein VGR49_06880 [Actinomycetota bacterium]|nr:hypothetical protein [Actinomycetota bacterium]
MRRVALALLAVLVAGACRREPTSPPRAGPAESPTPSPTPKELPGASCQERMAGDARNTPDFVAVDVESEGDVDRVTFTFRKRDGAPDVPPFHIVRFVDEPTTDPQGAPADIEGEAFVQIIFQAFGVDLSGEKPVEIYKGPKEFTPGFSTVLEVEELGDFEATISWGIGLSSRACFVLDATPTRITLEFPSGG